MEGGGGGGGEAAGKYLLPCCCIHDHVVKKLKSNLLTLSPGSGGWGGCRLLLHTLFPIICNLLTISPRSGGGVGIKIFSIMLICNMIMCEKVNFDLLTPKGVGRGDGTG